MHYGFFFGSRTSKVDTTTMDFSFYVFSALNQMFNRHAVEPGAADKSSHMMDCTSQSVHEEMSDLNRSHDTSWVPNYHKRISMLRD